MVVEQNNHRPGIEPMLPLINIVFLLLVFFLVAGNTHVPKVDSIQAPALVAKGQGVEAESYHWLYLTADGELTFRNKSIQAEQLAGITLPSPLYLYADGRTSGAQLSRTLNSLIAAGVKNLLIITERPADA